ncbi:hypothetical protein C4578_03045 [Candidatus Microgenomates bacterium]|jgi:hypothetical protein|nr:MAG: hypothetical protein C4578_03045 [Candidatus Microgenomates bacterium]
MKIHFLKIIAALSFLFCLIYFLKDINLPFVGPFGNNNATYSIQAKNYQKYGLLNTKFGPVNRKVGERFEYYLHHPPLLQLSTLLSYTLFGFENFWPGRFFPVLLTLASVLLLFLISKRIWGEKEGYLTLILASLCPFLLSFGKLIQFEPWVLFFSLVFVFLWEKEFAFKTFLLFFTTVFGSLSDWTFFLFLFSFFIIYKDKKQVKYLLTSLVTLLLFLTYVSFLVGFKELTTAYLVRSLGNEFLGKEYPFLKLFILTLIRIFIYFSPLAFLPIFYLVKEKIKKEVFVFLVFGILNIVLFLNGTFAHPYWLYYLSPFFILTLSRSSVILFENKKRYFRLFFCFSFALNLVFCLLVISYKDKQVKKSLWQNNFIDEITPLIGTEKIGVNWDFNEELFRYKTGLPIKIYWSEEEIKNDALEGKWRFFVFSCYANCSSKDRQIGNFLSEKFEVSHIEKEGRAFLFDLYKKNEEGQGSFPNSSFNSPPSTTRKGLTNYYRKLRDFLEVNQI